MAKKEKIGKKKGPLRKLSKCLFFWGNKRNSDKEIGEDSTLKRSHSESSISNTLNSENLIPATSKQHVDSSNIGECSGCNRDSNFQIYCKITDTPESESSENLTPDFELRHQKAEGISARGSESTDKNIDSTLETHRPHQNDIKVNDPKLQRFTITSVYEEENTYFREPETTIVSQKQEKPLTFQSSFTTVNYVNDTDLQKPVQLICQPSLNLNDVDKPLSEPEKYHPTCVSKNYSNYIDDNHSKSNFQPIATNNNDKEIGEQNLKSGISQLDRNSVNYVQDEVNRYHQSEILHSSTDSVIHENDVEQVSESKTFHSNLSSDDENNNIEMHKNKEKNFYLNRGSTNYVNDIDEQYSTRKTYQSVLGIASQSYISQSSLDSSNYTNDIVLKNSESHSSLSNSSLKAKDINVKHFGSQSLEEKSIDEGDSNVNSTTFVKGDNTIEVLPSDSCEKLGLTNKEANLTPVKSSYISSTPISTTGIADTGQSYFDQANFSRIETTVTDKEGSKIDSRFERDVSNIDHDLKSTREKDTDINFCKQLPSNSNNYAKSKQFDACKRDGISSRAMEEIDNPLPVNKNDEKYFKNNEEQLLENYPSISLVKGTSEFGMTLVVLPYINPSREQENWKVLSDLATKRNLQTDNDESSAMLRSQENVSVAKNRFPTKEENVTLQRHSVSGNRRRQSRVPVRKSAGPIDIIKRISKLSTEIEDINTNIKQNTVYNRVRSNSTNRSRSKIPRKCNDSK